MRVALMVGGSVVCALIVWGAVGQSVGALYGVVGWWVLLAVAWPFGVYFAANRWGD